MLRDRAKRKVKSKAKSKAKSKVRGAVRDEGGPKVLKAAAVGGTAYYAGKKISDKHQENNAQPQAAQVETTSSAPVPDTGADTVAQLQQLAQLHESGALTDEEFVAAKQKLLANS